MESDGQETAQAMRSPVAGMDDTAQAQVRDLHRCIPDTQKALRNGEREKAITKIQF